MSLKAWRLDVPVAVARASVVIAISIPAVALRDAAGRGRGVCHRGFGGGRGGWLSGRHDNRWGSTDGERGCGVNWTVGGQADHEVMASRREVVEGEAR